MDGSGRFDFIQVLKWPLGNHKFGSVPRLAKAVCYVAAWIAASGAANAAHAAPFATTLSTLSQLETAPFQGPDFLVLTQNQPIYIRTSDVAGTPGSPIPLKIRVTGLPGDNQLLIFTGLPQGVSLSPGGNFGRFWAVNANVISNLTLTAPPGYSGSFTITVGQKQDGSPSVSTASFKVTIGEPATIPTARVEQTPAKAAGQPDANEGPLLSRAKQLFQAGDVSGARALLEYLALQGSATAATAMAETYDPAVLGKMLIKGLEANPQKAREWYLKAEKLGGAEARGRLDSLATR
jgi:hypothetical protein